MYVSEIGRTIFISYTAPETLTVIPFAGSSVLDQSMIVRGMTVATFSFRLDPRQNRADDSKTVVQVYKMVIASAYEYKLMPSQCLSHSVSILACSSIGVIPQARPFET